MYLVNRAIVRLTTDCVQIELQVYTACWVIIHVRVFIQKILDIWGNGHDLC
jgi:hypothetical protein